MLKSVGYLNGKTGVTYLTEYVTGFWKTDRIVTFHNVQERQLKKFTIDNNSILLHECVAISFTFLIVK